MQRNIATLLAFLSVVAGAGSLHAFGGRGSVAYPMPAMQCYPIVHATPVYVPSAPLLVCPPAYVPTTPRVIPLTPNPVQPHTIVPAPIMPYAPTRPAPPSKTTEPPLGKTTEPPVDKTVSSRAPKIVETRTSKSDVTASRERCKVGFWNITDSDVDLNIAGKTHKLGKGRAITLELERQFSWSIGDGTQAQERIAEGKEFHEIVLRKK